MDVKPILTVGVGSQHTMEYIENVRKELSNTITDYYVILYRAKSDETVFNCFYEKDFNEVRYEELKKIILNQMSNNKVEVQELINVDQIKNSFISEPTDLSYTEWMEKKIIEMWGIINSLQQLQPKSKCNNEECKCGCEK